jgi:hypothetical protein
MIGKAPVTRITRVNIKPLLPPGFENDLNVERAIRKIEREILKQLRDKITQEAFSDRAKAALRNALKIVVGPRSVTVTTNHPAFKPLLEGQEAGQMTWLTKAKAPIPIVLDDGTLIFRSATPRSMKNGSWYHPGRPKTTVIQRAKAEARDLVKKRVIKELRRQIRDMNK